MEIKITIPDDELKQFIKLFGQFVSIMKPACTVKPIIKEDDRVMTEPTVQPDDAVPAPKCAHCGNEFIPTRRTQIFCSKECRLKAQAEAAKSKNKKDTSCQAATVEQPKKDIIKTCMTCGNEFLAENCHQRKCSECRAKLEKKQLDEIECKTCGQKFVPGRKNQRFCCRECAQIYYQWENGSRDMSLPEYLAKHGFKGQYGVKKCAHCGKDFVATTEDQKYCSKECKLAHRQVRLEAAAGLKAAGKSVSEMTGKKICLVCKMPFSPIDASKRFCDKCISSFGEEKCECIIRDEQLEKEQKKREQQHVMENQYKVCPRCGNSFHDPYNKQFFCDKCTRKAQSVKKIEPLKEDPSLRGITV